MNPTPSARLFALLPFVVFALSALPALVAAEPPRDPLAGVALTELSRKVVRLPDGGSVTYLRIAPPILAPRAAPAPAAPESAPTAEQLAAEEARAAKTYVNVLLMGVVYLGDDTTPTVTEIRWRHRAEADAADASDSLTPARRHTATEVRQLRAFVPFDLRHVDQLTRLETATHLYDFSVFLSPVPIASLPAGERPPELALFSVAATEPAYFFDGDEADAQKMEPTLRGLELLLAHAGVNRDSLARSFAEAEAANAERARHLAANPPPPAHTVIHFWKISP